MHSTSNFDDLTESHGDGPAPLAELVDVVMVQYKTREKEVLIQFSTTLLLYQRSAEGNHPQNHKAPLLSHVTTAAFRGLCTQWIQSKHWVWLK